MLPNCSLKKQIEIHALIQLLIPMHCYDWEADDDDDDEDDDDGDDEDDDDGDGDRNLTRRDRGCLCSPSP